MKINVRAKNRANSARIVRGFVGAYVTGALTFRVTVETFRKCVIGCQRLVRQWIACQRARALVVGRVFRRIGARVVRLEVERATGGGKTAEAAAAVGRNGEHVGSSAAGAAERRRDGQRRTSNAAVAASSRGSRRRSNAPGAVAVGKGAAAGAAAGAAGTAGAAAAAAAAAESDEVRSAAAAAQKYEQLSRFLLHTEAEVLKIESEMGGKEAARDRSKASRDLARRRNAAVLYGGARDALISATIARCRAAHIDANREAFNHSKAIFGSDDLVQTANLTMDDILHPAGFEAVLRAKKDAMAKPVWPPLTLYAKLNTDPAFKLAVQQAVKKALDDYEEVRRPASRPASQQPAS